MVSKRQRLARQRFKDANPDLFPEPPPPSDSSTKKAAKKKRLLSKKGKILKNAGGKHPLRVPGMRPGENCFICKGFGHAAKNCPEKAQWDRKKICLLCKQRGHKMKDCPNRSEAPEKFCYNCGETGHSLFKCPKPIEQGGTKFATCFICNQNGHLSKNCPENKHGVYPKGGCCKNCGEVTHLAKDCPNKKGNFRASGGLNTDPGIEERRQNHAIRSSGDDLEDDFIIEELAKGKGQDDRAKSNKKREPKVVNFLV